MCPPTPAFDEAEGLCAERLVPEHDESVVQVVLAGQELEGRVDEPDAEFICRELVEEGQELTGVTALGRQGGIHGGRAGHRGQLDTVGQAEAERLGGQYRVEQGEGHAAGGEDRREIGGGHGDRDEVPLPTVTPELEELLDRRGRLDALGDHFDVEGAAEVDDRLDDGPVARVGGDALDEAGVEFEAGSPGGA